MRNVYKSRKALSYDKAFWFVEEEPDETELREEADKRRLFVRLEFE